MNWTREDLRLRIETDQRELRKRAEQILKQCTPHEQFILRRRIDPFFVPVTDQELDLLVRLFAGDKEFAEDE